MEVHLVLKSDPEAGSNPVFHKADGSNNIVFTKFQTQFDFKSINYPDDHVFQQVAAPLIQDKLFKGRDSVLMTLGPTNSGKSHILFDDNNNSIINQSLNQIFENLEPLSNNIDQIKKFYPAIIDARSPDGNFDMSINSFLHCTVSMFELYNDTIIDLLSKESPNATFNNKHCLTIVTDPIDSKLTPRNISRYLVNSFDSAHEVIMNGLKHRKTDSTFTNAESSRSHCFIFFNIHKVYPTTIETTRFSIIDLAGLERSKSSKTSGSQLREASYTNGSLTELGRCLEMISIKQFHKTCLRTNKLTRLVLNDFVKFNYPVNILVTLDPFGEKGLITQTLRYINPIKYQDLQRKSLSGLKSKSLKRVSDIEQQQLIGEIDTLRSFKKSLKLENKDLKESIQHLKENNIEIENQIRIELYQENEQNLVALQINQKDEINRLTQNFTEQTDLKLDDQAASYRIRIDELKNILNAKEEELHKTSKDLETKELKLKQSLEAYDELNISSNEIKVNSVLQINSLNKSLEDTMLENENLKVELRKLELVLADLKESQQDELKSLQENHTTSMDNLKRELELSLSNVEKLNLSINNLSNELEQQQLDNKTNLVELKSLREELKLNSTEFDLQLNDKISYYQKIITERDTLVRDLEKSVILIQEKLSSTENNNVNLSEKLQLLKDSSEKLVQKLELEMKNKDKEYKLLLEKDTEKIDILRSKISELETDLDSKKSINKDNLNDFDEVKKEFETKISGLELLLDASNEKYNQLCNDKFEQEKRLSDVAEKLQVSNNEIKILKIEIEKETDTKNSLLDQLKNSDITHHESNSKVQELSNIVNSLNEQIDNKKSEIENLTLSKQFTDEKLATLNLKYSDLKSEYSDAQQYIEKYTSLKTYYENIVKNLKEEKKKYLDKIENMRADTNKQKETVETFNKRLEKKDKIIENLNKEVKKAENQISILTNNNTDDKNANADHLKQNEENNKKIQELMEKNKIISDKLKENEQVLLGKDFDIDALKKRCLNLQKENNTLSGRESPKRTRTSSRQCTPSPIKSASKSPSFLDTHPEDDVGIPPIFSSPLRAPEFKIYDDKVEKENQTITFGMKSKQSNKSKKLQKEKESKNRHSILTKTKFSDLNKKSNNNLISKFEKKRKNVSPIKPKKKKIKQLSKQDSSLEMLD